MRATFPAMSTLAEIEEAVDALPPAEQVALLAPPGAPAMTPEVLKALLVDFP